jgi:hypothetical protein
MCFRALMLFSLKYLMNYRIKILFEPVTKDEYGEKKNKSYLFSVLFIQFHRRAFQSFQNVLTGFLFEASWEQPVIVSKTFMKTFNAECIFQFREEFFKAFRRKNKFIE